MSMTVINDNYSEDIFQESDSQDLKIRRSQRLVKKHLNIPISQDIVPPNQMNFDFAPEKNDSSGEAKTFDQPDSCREQTPDFTHLHPTMQCNSNISAELCVENMLQNNAVIEGPLDLCTKQVKNLFVNNSQNSLRKNSIDKKNNSPTDRKFEIAVEELRPGLHTAQNVSSCHLKEKNLDLLANVDSNRNNDENCENKTAELNKKAEKVANLEKTTEVKVSDVIESNQRSLLKVSNVRTTLNKTNSSQIVEKFKTTSRYPHQSQVATPAVWQTTRNSKLDISNLSSSQYVKESQIFDAQCNQTTTKPFTVRQTNRRSDLKILNERTLVKKEDDRQNVPKPESMGMHLDQTEVKVVMVRQPKRKCTMAQTEKPDMTKSAPKTVSKNFRRGRPRGNRLTIKHCLQSPKQRNVVSVATETSSVLEYVPPKVMRYYNSCPAQTSFQSELCTPVYQSLLPTVYPSHFKNQVIIPPLPIAPPFIKPKYINVMEQPVATSSTAIPISFLTPENSQTIAIKSSNEVYSLPPSPSVENTVSLRDFFVIDEINDIFDLKKPIFELSETHIHALSIVLNINSEELFNIFANIVKMDNDGLQKLFMTS